MNPLKLDGMTIRSEGSEGPQNLSRRARHSAAEDPKLPASVVAAMTQGSEGWSGPIPHRDLFAEYDKVSPDMSERILRMIEAEAQYQNEHSRRIERSARISNIAHLAIALLTTVVTLLAAFALRAQQEDLLALLIALVPFVAAIAALGMSYSTLRRSRKEGKRG